MSNQPTGLQRTTSENNGANDWIFSSARQHFIETLWERVPKEIGCAFAASFLVSPLVGIIDKSIVQGIAGGPKFMKGFGIATHDLLLSPKTFFGSRAFHLTFAVYFGTFAVANISEAVMDAQKIQGNGKRKDIKVAAASAANISLLAWRDSVFARQFGAQASTPTSSRVSPTPMRTIGLFAARDATTMYATFYLAPRAAEYLRKEHGIEKNTAELSMALAIPMLAQVATAPMHIHAMDFYQNRNATLWERLHVIRHEFNTVSLARGLRILPVFGLGSFSNNKFRELFIRQKDENLLLRRRVTNYLGYNAPAKVPVGGNGLA